MDERLKKHPKLKARFESILDIAENTDGDCIKANDAEERVIEEMRRLGQETLQDWADERNSKETQRVLEEGSKKVHPYKKKLYWNSTYFSAARLKNVISTVPS